ncbi:MAG: DsrE family protein [Pseudomonadota bacterium]
MARLAAVLFAALAASVASAGEGAFSTGPAIDGFGPAASVETDFAIPEGMPLRLSFDVSTRSKPGKTNSTLVAAARFINMHARAGVADDRMQLAVVVHGKAVFDVASAGAAGEGKTTAHANEPLVTALIEQGVRIIVCGQSAAYYDVTNEALLPGVEMALSAMTAHAVLQQQGYALNPF